MYMCILPVYIFMGYPTRPEDGDRLAETVVRDSCELPCGFWKSDPGPLGEQLALLSTRPFLHSLVVSIFLSSKGQVF